MSELRNINENSLIEVFSDGKKIGECIDSEFTRNLYSQNKIELFGFAPIELNENQQVVLGYLKTNHSNLGEKPVTLIWALGQIYFNETYKDMFYVIECFDKLNTIEQAQVLQIFIAWVQEQEDENNE